MRDLILIVLIIFYVCNLTQGQTASVERGCVPLTVLFESPNASNHFWDFKDGASSNLQFPEHIFTEAGVFNVELRDEQGGTILGTVEVTVFADPIINVTPDVNNGCAPLNVNFNSSIDLDSELTLETIKWSFGDGSTSIDANPVHTYNIGGEFDVSLAITTNIEECDKTLFLADLIQIEDVGNLDFGLDIDGACAAPSTIGINNNTIQVPGVSYEWDFGNGTTSNAFSPAPVNYTSDGVYTITLTASGSGGCSQSFERMITVGEPIIDFVIPDTVCVQTLLEIENNTATAFFRWQFGDDANISSSLLREPRVLFSEGGLHTITLRAFNDTNCIVDTSFQVFVENISASFSLTPGISCFQETDIMLSADDKNLAQYIWDGDLGTGPEHILNFICPERDSFYIEIRDTFKISLDVFSDFGCAATDTVAYFQRKPFAHFLPSTTQGCAPLEVTFEDVSETETSFNSSEWLFGDGNTASNLATATNTYTEPGEYFVKLVVETIEGCRDTSAGRWIHVGSRIAPEYTISDTDICLHESISISLDNVDDRIDRWHVYTDDGRTGHCDESRLMTHNFRTEPGDYEVTFTIDYNGCVNDVTAPETINVRGANANLDHMYDCQTPYDIMLTNSGLMANQVSWSIDTLEISNDPIANYTFPDRGSYIVTLITEDTNSGCPADTTMTELFITDPVADFILPDMICEDVPYTLDASNSVDVDIDCWQGFLWNLPFAPRPRELRTDTISHIFFEPGEYDVRLVVEDRHGCRDTIIKSTRVYGIDPEIAIDKELICAPDMVTFTNLSTADTSIVSAVWSTGGSDIETMVEYSKDSLVFVSNDSVAPFINTLVLTDALGCRLAIMDTVHVYQPTSGISFDQGPTICLGEEISFVAVDYTAQGSSLNFNWDFGPFGTSNEQTTDITFDQTGSFPMSLAFEEISSGCGDTLGLEIVVVPFPEANFISPLDDVDPICFPTQIELSNVSVASPSDNVGWFADGVGPFGGDEPVFAFERGTHLVDLIVTSPFGCADTLSKSYTLVGPEGNFTISDDALCLGDEITVGILDTVDVTGWRFAFGDGVVVENISPATHVYDFNPDEGFREISLTLFSEETGCETIEKIQVTIDGPIADYEVLDSLEYCQGLALFNNLSEDATQFEWSVDGGVFSTETNPSFNFNATGDFDVTLTATNPGSPCVSDTTQTITLGDLSDDVMFTMPNVFTPNSDGLNDFFNIVSKNPDFQQFIRVITFKIYDRWGQLIYDNDDPTSGWDGNYNADFAPAAVYAYYIEYELIDCNNQSEKGNVTLIR